MIQPETKYTMVGDAAVGYQVVGNGPIDVVFITGLGSNIETMWEWPLFARMLQRIASYSRLILFDPRGSGISDPLRFEPLPTWEHWTDDLRAVLAAAGSQRPAVLAQYDGGLQALLYAATYPDRTAALVLWNGYARSTVAPDYPSGWDDSTQTQFLEAVAKNWGTSAYAGALGRDAGNAEDLRWITKYWRTSMTPVGAAARMRYVSQLDLRSVLPSIQAPTLVMYRRDSFMPLEWGRYVADHIPGARLVVFDGADWSMLSGLDAIQDEIQEFLTGTKPAPETDRVLATILFTDIVGSTERAVSLGDRKWKELLALHDRTARTEIERFRGKLVTRTGDGVLATFDGPGRAIRCAIALGIALEAAGIEIRAGLHTGEIELREDDDIGGIAVHIASRVMAQAQPGEVVCSRTVKDLVAGSEFAFEDRGTQPLKGVPDPWQLYVVRKT